MKFQSIASLLFLTASAFIGEVSARGRGVISVETIQARHTEYLGGIVKAKRGLASTQTLYQTSTTTIKSAPATITHYITKAKSTSTVLKTITRTFTTRVGENGVQTVYETATVSGTSTIHDTAAEYSTLPPLSIVPTPIGFIAVGDDLANAAANFPDLTKRSVPIKCTVTIKTTLKVYIIGKQKTTTVTKYGATVTSTTTFSTTKTIIPSGAEIITITKGTTTTIYQHTVTETTVTTSTHEPTNQPEPTRYAACEMESNIFTGPNGNIGAMVGLKHVVVEDIETPEACCVACHSHKGEDGEPNCAGSFFVVEDDVPTCVLKTETTCKVNTPGLVVSVPNDGSFEGWVSNGPCGQWKILTGPNMIP